MLISRKVGFIFVHVDKAAGTSIEIALASHAEPFGSWFQRKSSLLGRINRFRPHQSQVCFSKHASAREISACLPPDLWARCYKFAFVRNPWDRLTSRYRYIRGNPEHRHHLKVRALTFPQYAAMEMASHRSMRHQHEYLCDDAGVMVDFVGRFERLEEDFGEICNRIGINSALGHVNSTPQTDFRSYYDDSLAETIGHFYAKDIALFGYTFD
jgi:hypothetical protein